MYHVNLQVFPDGTKEWRVDDERRRVDGPAIEYPNGTTEWYLDGKRHRADGPAIEYSSGSKHWYLNGKRHRTDGPASEFSDGVKIWFLNDIIHRLDGPAVECPLGTGHWHVNGKRYRVDGPAFVYSNGTTEWWVDGKRHRIDGPAVDGLVKEWYLNDKSVTEKYILALCSVRKFRDKIRRYNTILGFNVGRMIYSTKTREFIEWYYSPDNIGGKISKERISSLLDQTSVSFTN